jgi:hypothetical protein
MPWSGHPYELIDFWRPDDGRNRTCFFEKNWSSGYQEEVKDVQMLTDTIHHVCPPLGAKLLP